MSMIRPTYDTRQKSPRRKSPKHLDMIRQLPCLICGAEPPVGGGNDALHIRYGARFYMKRPVGVGEKQSDCWTVPGCRSCHTAQHAANEDDFWREWGGDPNFVALLLYAHSGDMDVMQAIIKGARRDYCEPPYRP